MVPRRPPPPARRRPPPAASTDPCNLYRPDFLDARSRVELEAWLRGLHPLWEQRFSTSRPLPAGKEQRPLLRPVYWLGNWQFACLGYYEPPRRTADCAVRAEPFPPVLAQLTADIERRVRARFPPHTVPAPWRLNTCLVNFYGDRLQGSKWIDVARVGDHRDLEPGPVASLSLGERALFQFVRRGGREAAPAHQLWLEDNSLQVFGGSWKDALLHRVQRVEDKRGLSLGPPIEGFRTRRINLTLRFVPDRHVVPFAQLSGAARADVREYVTTLAAHSPFFAKALAAEARPPAGRGAAPALPARRRR